MAPKSAREIVAIEMDYWRNHLLEKVQETRGREYLTDTELIVASNLTIASIALQQEP